MTYTHDRILKLASQQRKLMIAAKNIGFNVDDANDLEHLMNELLLFSSLVQDPEHKQAIIERFTDLFRG